MPRKKLKRILTLKEYKNVIINPANLSHKASPKLFDNTAPISLELGCGKGHYTVALARQYPAANFIGIDLKADRLWCGAKQAQELNLSNVLFIQEHIKNISRIFGKNKIAQIWITFPDPLPKKSQAKHRLTSPDFLKKYHAILKPHGIIHLKTDDLNLIEYTLKTAIAANFKITDQITDIHHLADKPEILNIKTAYEEKYTAQSKPIHYLQLQKMEKYLSVIASVAFCHCEEPAGRRSNPVVKPYDRGIASSLRSSQ